MNLPFLLFRVFAAGLAFWAMAKHPYNFYVLLKWTVFVCGIWGVIESAPRFWKSFGPVYLALAILFNPLIPFHFKRGSWVQVDIATGVLLLVSLPFGRRVQTDS